MIRLVSGLGWPLLWGTGAAAVFHWAALRGSGWLGLRPSASLSYGLALLELGLLGAGLVCWWRIARVVSRQFDLIPRTQLPDPPMGGQDAAEAGVLLEAMQLWPPAIQQGWLAERLSRGLELVQRQRSAETLDRELNALATEATDEARERLAWIRSLPWITAGLGALVLVAGTAEAIRQIQLAGPESAGPNQLAASVVRLYEPLQVVALALTSTLALIVAQSIVGRSDSRLLRQLDHEARRQLAGRFQVPGTARDPRLVLLDRLTERLELTAEVLVERQALVWRESFERASQQWLTAGDAIRRQLEQGLHSELERTLQEHFQRLGQLHDHAEQRVERWWQELQVALMRTGGLLERQQDELLRLGDVMTRVLKATGEVAKLEHTLNRNLKALAGAKNFEDTVMALSAAIHLLNSRVGVQHRGPELNGPPSQGKAA